MRYLNYRDNAEFKELQSKISLLKVELEKINDKKHFIENSINYLTDKSEILRDKITEEDTIKNTEQSIEDFIKEVKEEPDNINCHFFFK